MCPLCILTAIVIGGGGSVACGIQWVKGKLGAGSEADGCQTLRLTDAPPAAERSEAAEPPPLLTPAH